MGSLNGARDCKTLRKSAEQAQEPRIRFVEPLASGVQQRNAEFLRGPAGHSGRPGYALRAVHDDVKASGIGVKLRQELFDGAGV